MSGDSPPPLDVAPGDVAPGDVQSDAGDPLFLPDAVRRHLAELAAAVLGELPEAQTPPALRRVRTFTPARRPRAGAGPLGAALERDHAFRARVASAWRAIHADLAAALDDGRSPPSVDPDLALAGLFLLRPTGWPELAAVLGRQSEAAAQEGRRSADQLSAQAQAQAAAAELSRLAGALAAERARVRVLEEELIALRRDLRKQRSEADRARALARAAQEAVTTSQGAAQEATARAEEIARQADERVREWQERAEQARRAMREGRSLSETRARLLLDTIVGAATGLRRELALAPVTVRPADLIGAPGVAAGATPGPQARSADDPAILEQLLALPQAHLIVDGYNVTKTGYPSAPLAEQRRRLTDGLAVLAARTAAEVTCCFDGADVEAPSAARVRGIRVLFSEPGMSADELIRRLVRAEPAGRPVVVVSSDGEVMAGVHAAGARAVDSAALLRLLARG